MHMNTRRIAIVCVALMAGLPASQAAAPTRQAALSWGEVTQDVEGNTIAGVTYNVYRGARGSAVTQKTAIAQGLTTLAYVDAGRFPGTEDCYQVTAFKDQESAPSAEGCKSYPAVAPRAPAITVQ